MTRKPQTMDEVLSLSADEFREIDDWMYRGDLSPKRLTKGLVRIIASELEWLGREDSMSLRGLWYSGFKTAYQNAWPERWENDDYYSAEGGAGRRFAQYMSEALSEMVKDGEVTYRELNIVDESRQREISHGTIEDDKILFVEKEAAYRRLLPIQRVFKISLVSGGGWEATALIEDMANLLDPDQQYQLFVLSDYDPTGYEIADDFENRARQLGVNITQVERVGIEPDQVSPRVREQERFVVPVEDDKDERWLARYGIENRYGLELEAIGEIGEGGQPLREIVVEALRPHLRFRERIKQDAEWGIRRTAYFATDRLVDDLTESLYEALLDYAANQLEEIDGVEKVHPNHPVDGWPGVDAEVDLDEYGEADHRFRTPLLSAEDYVENAVEAPTDEEGEIDVVRPSYWQYRDRLKRQMQDQVENGDIDAAELLGLE